MVNRTSRDGETTLEVLEVNGRSYDLPPWINAEEFIAGVTSNSEEEALSRLVSCEISAWQTNRDGYDKPQEAVFDLVFEVPIGGIQELVCGRFTPLTNDRFGGYVPEIEILDDFIRVSLRAEEYMDFNDVQLIVFPKDNFPEEYPSYPYSDDILYEYHANPKGFISDVTGWNGQYLEFAHPETGAPMELLLKVHED